VEATSTAEQPEEDGIRIAAAGPREAGRLVAVVRRFHAEGGYGVGPAQATAIRDLCSDHSLGRALLPADAGRGRDVGHALACWRHSIDHGGRVAVLDDLWIDPALRGRGPGTRLLRAALADVAGVGARAVVVEADPADAPAMAFYARLGFAPKGTTCPSSGPMRQAGLVEERRMSGSP
jgi:ribosomal protein S18 acetylase RimI-like enzyme